MDGIHPVGVFGTLIALAVSPVLGALGAFLVITGPSSRCAAGDQALGAAGSREQWVASSALAFSHGANDAQKAVGVIAALLVADGEMTDAVGGPNGAELACAVALTGGTALGGWRIIRTVGRRIYRIRALEASPARRPRPG